MTNDATLAGIEHRLDVARKALLASRDPELDGRLALEMANLRGQHRARQAELDAAVSRA